MQRPWGTCRVRGGSAVRQCSWGRERRKGERGQEQKADGRALGHSVFTLNEMGALGGVEHRCGRTPPRC